MGVFKGGSWRRCCWVALMGLAWTACGRQESRSSLDALEQPTRPLIMILGGNASCRKQSPFGTDMFVAGANYINQVGRYYGMAPRYVISCHTFSSDVHFVTSDAPETVRNVELAGFGAVFRDMLEPETPVVMVGHSYGGWLAMKLALINPQVKIAELATIDPISRDKCTFTRPIGCRSAPKDISHVDRLSIKSHTSVWNNFYQTTDPVLHSSPVEGADLNVKILTVHTGIDNAAYVWDTIWQTTDLAGKMAIAQR